MDTMQNLTAQPNLNDLGRELLEIEAEVKRLNSLRADLYRRSLQAEAEDKLCLDVVATAMLDGPLHARQEIKWPIEVCGVGWSEETASAQFPTERVWVKLVLDTDPQHEYLALLLCTVAMAVEARFGEGELLHLKHANHVPLYFCPAVGRVVLFSEARTAALENADELQRLHGGEAAYPWHFLAWEDLRSRHPGAQEANEPTSAEAT